jgi:hypothetical protein
MGKKRKHIKNYANSLSFRQFVTIIFLCSFFTGLGISFIYLQFRVRDLKIAINATEKRIQELQNRENQLEATIQAQVMKWKLKQTAIQELGMIDFNPKQTSYVLYPHVLHEKYNDIILVKELERESEVEVSTFDRVLEILTTSVNQATESLKEFESSM